MFQPLGTIKLYAWVREEFARFGASFDAQAVSVLVERAGSDLWRLSGEIHKLASFRKKGAITAEDVRELVSTTYDDNMFRLTDAICQKRPGVALKVLEQQFQLGVSPQYLLYRLHWQVRLLRDARNVEPQTEQAVRETLSVHAFVAKKTLQAVKRFSREQLDQMIARLVAVDVELKSRSTDARALLDLCVIAMCRPKR
jgi:DNA polymerase III delta subunit